MTGRRTESASIVVQVVSRHALASLKRERIHVTDSSEIAAHIQAALDKLSLIVSHRERDQIHTVVRLALLTDAEIVR